MLVTKRAKKAERLSSDGDEAIWVMSDGTIDLDSESVDPHGIDFEAWDRRGAPVLDNHDTDKGVHDAILGRVTEHWIDEIGEGTRWPQPGGPKRPAVLCKIRWNTATQKGREAKEMSDAGMLNSGSVSFFPKGQPTYNKAGGKHYPAAELIEFSLVNVPANPSAIRLKRYKGLDDGSGAYSTAEEMRLGRCGAAAKGVLDWISPDRTIKPGDRVDLVGSGSARSVRVVEISGDSATVERDGRRFSVPLSQLSKALEDDGDTEDFVERVMQVLRDDEGADEGDEELAAMLEQRKRKLLQVSDRVGAVAWKADLLAAQQSFDVEVAKLMIGRRR